MACTGPGAEQYGQYSQAVFDGVGRQTFVDLCTGNKPPAFSQTKRVLIKNRGAFNWLGFNKIYVKIIRICLISASFMSVVGNIRTRSGSGQGSFCPVISPSPDPHKSVRIGRLTKDIVGPWALAWAHSHSGLAITLGWRLCRGHRYACQAAIEHRDFRSG